MWILIAGNLMCFFISTLIYKILMIQNLTFLQSNEKIIGWFLIAYIPETYCNLSVKFFLINEEFRQLITNCLLVSKNILSLSYLITSVEFINLTFTVLFISFLLILHLKYLSDKNILPNTLQKNDFVHFTILFSLNINFFLILKTYSIKFFSIPFLLISNYFICDISLKNITLVFSLVTIYYLLYTKYNYYRIIIFFLQFCLFIILNYYLFKFEIISNNNFINEFCLKQLYFYTFITSSIY